MRPVEHGPGPRVIALVSALLVGLVAPAGAQVFTASGSVVTTPTNVPVPTTGSVYNYGPNTLYVGSGAPGSFSSIAGATMSGSGLSIGLGGTGSGTVTLSGAGNVTQLGGAQSRLEIGNWGTGSLVVSAGALVNAAVANAACSASVFCGSFVGNAAGSTGTLTVTGAGSEVRVLQFFAIGQTAVFTTAVNGFNFGTPGGTTNGSVNVLAGGTLRTQQAGVGAGPNTAAALGTERGNGTVIVDGVGSQWIVTPNAVENAAAGVTVGNRTGGNGTVEIRNGGRLLIDGSSGSGPNDFLNIGVNGGTGSVTVAGAGSSLQVTGFGAVIQAGRSGLGGQGSFSVLAGATADALYLNIGRDQASGTVLVDGAGSRLNLVGVGAAGNGGAGILAGGTGGTGAMTVSNGGRVFIGDGGGDGRTQSNSLGMTVGRESGSTGRLTVTGPGSSLTMSSTSLAPAAGVADNLNPGLVVGRDAGSRGELSITNGGQVVLEGNAVSTVANTRSTFVSIGGNSDTSAGGRGTALVSGSGSALLVTGADTFIGVGRGTGSVGELTIANGGLVAATNMSVGRGGGTGTLVVDNATLQLLGQQTGNFLSGASLAIGTASGTGSATISNGSTVNIANSGSAGAALNLGGSALFPLGTGSLAVSGGSTVTIAAGSLGAFNVGRDGTGTALVTGASTVDVGAGSTYIGRVLGGTGSLTLQGGSLLNSAYVGVGATPAGDGGTGRLIVSDSTVTATTIEIGTNGYVGGNNGVLNGDVILHGTLSPGDSPGSVVINGRLRSASGHLILDVASDGAGGYITDRILLTLGTAFAFPGLEVTFNFLSTDPFAFAASGLFDMDTFLRSLDPTTGQTTGLSTVFAPGQTWDTLFASATFNAISGGATIPGLTVRPDGTFTVAAIPEPETWALMGLGLGCLGWVTRRRQRALALA